jgi:hypothetical protein
MLVLKAAGEESSPSREKVYLKSGALAAYTIRSQETKLGGMKESAMAWDRIITS